MSQNIWSTIVPSSTSGNQLATLLNNFKDAMVSGLKGPSRPATLQAGGYFIDDSLESGSDLLIFKLYDGAQDITLFTINKATGTASSGNSESLFEILKTSDDTVGAKLRLKKKRTTGNQTLTNDVIGEVQFYGTRADLGENLQARIYTVSTDDVSALVQGSYMAFEVTTDAAAAASEIMRLISGSVGIGTTVPDETLHVKGTGVKIEKASDDTVGAKAVFKKKRITGVGQVQSGDVLALNSFNSTDDTGLNIETAQIEVSALELHTSTSQGTGLKIKTKKTGQSTHTTRIDITSTTVDIPDLTVGGVSNTEIGYLDGVTSGIQSQLAGKISSTEKGAVSGVCPLNASTKIDATYLPSYVDDILEYANFAGLPITGETGVIYITLDTNKTYRWSGAVYVEVSTSLADTFISAAAFTLTNARHFESQLATDATTTGSNASLTAFTAGLVRITNGSLVSISNIPAGANGQILCVLNRTGVDLDIIDSSSAVGTASDRIFTGSSGSITFPKDAGLIFVYDTTTSSRWNVAGGAGSGSGAGGGSLIWVKSGVISPVTEFIDGFEFESFDDLSTQEIYAVIAVPSTYRVGKPIKLKGGNFFCNTGTGKVFFKASSALIEDTTVLGTYSNIHASTNTVVTVNATPNTNNLLGDLDLTSSTGTINSVGVSPGDKLRVRLYRDNSAEAGGAGSAAADARLLISALELTFA